MMTGKSIKDYVYPSFQSYYQQKQMKYRMTQKVLYMTYKVIDLPVLTFVARQKGEAWNHPFVCVYEPSSDTEPGDIASVDYFTPSEQGAVGIIVKLKNGTEQRIVCSENGKVSLSN